MKNKKTARKPNRRFLSVVPVTSREDTGTTAQHRNPRAIMKQRVRVLTKRRIRDAEEIKRLNAAITALGKQR